MRQCNICAYMTTDMRCIAPISAAHMQMVIALPSAFQAWPPKAPIDAPEQECSVFKQASEDDDV